MHCHLLGEAASDPACTHDAACVGNFISSPRGLTVCAIMQRFAPWRQSPPLNIQPACRGWRVAFHVPLSRVHISAEKPLYLYAACVGAWQSASHGDESGTGSAAGWMVAGFLEEEEEDGRALKDGQNP